MIRPSKHPLVHIHIPSGCGFANLVQTSMQVFNQLRTRQFGRVMMWQSTFSWQFFFLKNEKSENEVGETNIQNEPKCMLIKFWRF
jgi:hypothetical protein